MTTDAREGHAPTWPPVPVSLPRIWYGHASRVTADAQERVPPVTVRGDDGRDGYPPAYQEFLISRGIRASARNIKPRAPLTAVFRVKGSKSAVERSYDPYSHLAEPNAPNPEVKVNGR